jgi:hypothetical protein
MTTQQFNKKFKRQGGIKQLSNMRDGLCTLKSISEHFSVSKERVRQWMVLFFGEAYDPRMKRRERRIKSIELLVEKYGVKKTKDLYLGLNRRYLKEALININHRNKTWKISQEV